MGELDKNVKAFLRVNPTTMMSSFVWVCPNMEDGS